MADVQQRIDELVQEREKLDAEMNTLTEQFRKLQHERYALSKRHWDVVEELKCWQRKAKMENKAHE